MPDTTPHKQVSLAVIRTSITRRVIPRSPPAGQTTITAYTLYPDQEDLNKDNTMNTLEEYFEYKVNLPPGQPERWVPDFITDQADLYPQRRRHRSRPGTSLRIPISEYYQKVGNIPDFKSIQFMRMYLTGFSDSVVCRFAQLQLVRNSWRSFNYVIDTTGNYTLLPVNSLTTLQRDGGEYRAEQLPDARSRMYRLPAYCGSRS